MSVGTDRGTFAVPTVVNGRQLTKDAASKLFMSGKLKAVGGPFETLDIAEEFIKKRSRESGKKEKQAERERIEKRVRATERRIGRKLPTSPPRPISRGRLTKKAKALKTKEPGDKTISGAFRRAAGTLSGEDTRRRIKEAID